MNTFLKTLPNLDFVKKLLNQHRHFLLYGGIGMSAVVVDLSVFFVLYNFIGLVPVVATILSVATSMVYAFILNAFYNFKTKDLIKRRLFFYALVSTLGMFLSAVIIEALSRYGLSPNIAKAISLPPIVLIQYVLNLNITFFKTNKTKVKVLDIQNNNVGQSKNIAIVGGGFTGLTAAYQLSKKGHKVTVFEASNNLGGLVAGFALDGLPLEKAYHFLYKTDSEIINLANEIGVGDKLNFYPSSLSLYYRGNLYPFMTPKDLLFFTPLGFFDRIRAGLIALYLSYQKNWRGFAKVSAMDWMSKWAGPRVTKVIWEPILRGKFFNFYDKIAMSYVWSRVFVRANSKDKGDVTEKLGYFDGGFQSFSEALVEKARAGGVEFKLSSKLESIKYEKNEVLVKNGDETISFDACLATTPSHVFGNLIKNNQLVDKEYLNKLNAIDYIGAVLMVFSTNEKFTDYYWHNINDTEHPFLVLLSLSALVGTDKLQGKNVYYVGAYVPHDHKYFSMSDDELSQLWIDGIKKVFPHFDESTITSNNIFRFKNAQHIVDVDYEKKIPDYRSKVPGVYLANFSQIFPDDRGTNYAVAEGNKIAEMINNDLLVNQINSDVDINSKRAVEIPLVMDSSNDEEVANDVKVSIILPTFNEGKNISVLLAEINKVMSVSNFDYECIFVDDSNDNTEEIIKKEAKKYKNVFLIKRQGEEAKSGLTMAFRRGFSDATGDFIVCMDTDLQHPPNKIIDLVKALNNLPIDVAVCSRYASGGSAAGLDNFYRRLVSKISTYITWILLPATRRTSDPMTGFFAFRKNLLNQVSFSSYGFKILVELLTSLGSPAVFDIPFKFRKRNEEKSKASISQGLRFFKDIFRIFAKTNAGDIFVKYILVAILASSLYLVLSVIVLLSDYLDFLPANYPIPLIAITLPASLVFIWVFKFYDYSRLTLLNIVSIFSFIVLAFWIFSIFSILNNSFWYLLINTILFFIVYVSIYLALKPIWLKEFKAISYIERLFVIAFIFVVFSIFTYFLSLGNLWHILLFSMYLAVILQGFFALYLMVYAWEDENNTKNGQISGLLISPKHSFTAIIPCKHEKATIADTLEAMRNINYPEHLKQILIVIHQDSDDGTINVVAESIAKFGDNNVKLVTYNQEPVNKPHGLNKALKEATGDYVVIFDAEDEPHPDLFKVINTFLIKNDFDVVQSGVQLMNYDSNWYSMFNVLEYYFWFKSSLHFYAKHGVAPLGGVSVFFKTKMLKQIGGWDVNCLTEDADIGIKLSQAGAKIGVVYDAQYATQEETPPTVWGFIKQRTRWAQGFLQILYRREYLHFPTFKQKILALYVLAWPIILPFLFSIFPLGMILMFTVKLPPSIALVANISLLIFLVFVAVLVVGFYEFTKDYNRPFPWSRLPILVLLFYPYTLLLVLASFRAMYRSASRVTSWEKTEHLNKHRVKIEKMSRMAFNRS